MIPVYLGNQLLDEVDCDGSAENESGGAEVDRMAFQYLVFNGENLPLPDSYGGGAGGCGSRFRR